MENKKEKLSVGWVLVILNMAFGMSATLNTGWLFSSYYQLCADACNLNAAQMGVLLSIIDGCGIIGYVVGGMLVDILKPKACIFIGSLGMILFSLWGMMIPDYPSLVIINTGLVVFGIVFYWTACVRYASSFGPRSMSGKASGLLFALSGAIMLVYGNIISAVIASVSAVSGFRWLVGSSVAILAVTAIAHCIYDKTPWFGRGMKTENAGGGFQFSMIGTLLKNKRMWIVWLIAAVSSSSTIAITYMNPLLANYYGASTAAITLIRTWANNGTLLVLSMLTGILTDKLGSASKMINAAFICMLFGMLLLLFTPWTPALLVVVIIAMVLVRSVNSIGKPGRVALVAEVDIPEAAKGTATGLMFAATSIPGTFLNTIFGNLLTRYNNEPIAYQIIYGSFVGIAILGIAAVLLFVRLSKKAAAA